MKKLLKLTTKAMLSILIIVIYLTLVHLTITLIGSCLMNEGFIDMFQSGLVVVSIILGVFTLIVSDM
jgi:hypothetical protein